MLRINITILLLLASFKSFAAADSLQFIVLFEVDKSNVSQIEYEKLLTNIDSLDSSTIDSIEVKGYCDDRASDAYNDILSLKRAKKIESILKNEISGTYRIEGNGRIALDRKSTNIISNQRTENRKVEIIIYKQPTEIQYIEIVDSVIDSIIIKPEEFIIGKRLTLRNIIFDPDKSRFLPQSYSDLNRLLLYLEERQNVNVKILGHINYTKSNRYNYPNKDYKDLDTGKPLSLERAKAVETFLVKNGIDKTRISCEGLGGLYPSKRGGKTNRRVEIELTIVDE